MLRRLVALLIALTIATLGPSIAASPGLGVMAERDCSCPMANPDGDNDCKMTCAGALACAAQCGVAAPMLVGALHMLAPPAALADGPTGHAGPTVSALSAPPFRPPETTILA